ncbi:hypothetical protein AVEN_165336-1 [Araneus ventricosus]|uniref:RNase H type-1 domain-containing protein n=1 Tax=Araneus ventricosus TaxID=182803 RepID=A0A4Y2AUB7_ARAVE|nr:hypothetical protein AVEN_165336-1 [Araneus ventricosus]
MNETVKNILRNREVAMQTAQGLVFWPQQQGCAQIFCTGPLFWNLVANEILLESWEQGVHLQAFADDFVFVIREPTGTKLKFTAHEVLAVFKRWTDKHKISVSIEKSCNNIINEPIHTYTDGSKMDNRTGCAFCVRENNIYTIQWMAQLKLHNSVFQAELIALKEAYPWASQSNQTIKIWTDSESSLHSISYLKTNSPLAQDIQNTLINSPNIKLGWIKGRVGHAGNEATDLLAKKASLEGIPTQYPASRSYLKK